MLERLSLKCFDTQAHFILCLSDWLVHCFTGSAPSSVSFKLQMVSFNSPTGTPHTGGEFVNLMLHLDGEQNKELGSDHRTKESQRAI